MGSPVTGIAIAAGLEASPASGPAAVGLGLAAAPGLVSAPLGDGRPVIEHVVEALASVCAEVVVVSDAVTRREGAGDAATHGLRTGVRFRFVGIEDAPPGSRAPLLAGLTAAAHPVALAVTATMPWLRPGFLEALLARFAADERPAAAPTLYGILRPYPCVLRVDGARHAQGRRDGSVLALLEEIGVAPLPELAWRELDPDGASLQSVERPDDLVGPAPLPVRGWLATWAGPARRPATVTGATAAAADRGNAGGA